METFRTDQPAPSTDLYHFTGHLNDNNSCKPRKEDRNVPLIAGEIFRFADSVETRRTGQSNLSFSYLHSNCYLA